MSNDYSEGDQGWRAEYSGRGREGRPFHGRTGGAGWLAAHGEWYFNDKAASQDIAIFWGAIALLGVLRTPFGQSGFNSERGK